MSRAILINLARASLRSARNRNRIPVFCRADVADRRLMVISALDLARMYRLRAAACRKEK